MSFIVFTSGKSYDNIEVYGGFMRLKLVKIVGITAGILLIIGLVVLASVTSGKGKPISEDLGETVELEEGVEGVTLTNYSGKNIKITRAGVYAFFEDFDKSIIVEADGNVTLIFNKVTIQNEKTAAIINNTEHKLTIALTEEEVSKFYGGSNRKYKGVIYSEGEVEFMGDQGGLVIMGRLADTEPIYTDKKITVRDGTIVMLSKKEFPTEKITTTQNKIHFAVKNEVKKDSSVAVLDNLGDSIMNFVAEVNFSHLTMTSASLTPAKHFLYVDDTLVMSEMGE